MWATSWATRLENVVLAYVRYISKLFWPQDLAIVYSFPNRWPALLAAGAALLLLTWTALSVYRARQYPYLPVGWFWFLGTLVPTIGLVQVGAQSIADRYTYIPSIGFFIVVVWGACDLATTLAGERKISPARRRLGAHRLSRCDYNPDRLLARQRKTFPARHRGDDGQLRRGELPRQGV